MQKSRLVSLLLVLVALTSIAMFVGGLPWGSR
jgi:hypothetical protein